MSEPRLIKFLRPLVPTRFLNFYRRRRSASENQLDFAIQHLLAKELPTKERAIIFDVGANVGQSILRFSSYVDLSIIHTFEPIPSCHEVLKNRFQGTNYVHNLVALSNSNGVADFYELAKSDTSSLNPPDLESSWAYARAKQYSNGEIDRLVKSKYSVPTMTLDKYVETLEQLQGKRIHLLKMDTQGHEDKILEGAKNLLSDHLQRPLLIESEIIVGSLYEKRLNFFDLEQYLVRLGYRLIALSNGGNIVDSPGLGFNVLYASPELSSKIPR